MCEYEKSRLVSKTTNNYVALEAAIAVANHHITVVRMAERRGRKIIEREIEKEFFDIGFGKEDKAAWKQTEKARKRIKVQVRKDEDVTDRAHKDKDAAVEENVKTLLRVSANKIDSGSEKVRQFRYSELPFYHISFDCLT